MKPWSAPVVARNDAVAGWSRQRWLFALAMLVAIAFLFRARLFGYPLIDVDEEFYLLVGDRMLHGAIPYVDIWDRKPPGLFLIYAAIRLLGGTGIVQYQAVAALFASATAVVIAVLARRIVPPIPALIAGFAYIPAASSLGGAGGQTPIFYNLPVALAALILVSLVSPTSGLPAPVATIRRRGTVAMLLLGLALEVKPTAVFEGIFFGLVLLWLAWKQDPRPARRIGDAALWIMVALLPSLVALAIFTALGHAGAFLYATIGSIFARGADSPSDSFKDLRHILGRTVPLLVPMLVGEWVLRPHAGWRRIEMARAAHVFFFGWFMAALFGFAIFGTYFDHYALPLLPPLAVLASIGFSIRTRWVGPALAFGALAALCARYPFDIRKFEKRRGDTAYVGQMADAIRAHLDGGCLYIFYGQPILYQLTGACMPTRWPFPFHLSLEREAGALGVDPEAEVRRIVDARPTVIVDALTDDDGVNPRTQAILRDALHRDYDLVFSSKHGGEGAGTDQVWARRPGA